MAGIFQLVLLRRDRGHSNLYALDFSDNFVGDLFQTSSDNGGAGPGTDITEESPCYCPGTLIRTKWIGRRSYSGRFVIGRKDILPVCIKAGALTDNVPKRNLWISPNHAMYLDSVLIEAKDLTNGVSIAQAERVEQVEYFPIELETHDVIIAEGALSESYIDDDNRLMFHNANEYRQLRLHRPCYATYDRRLGANVDHPEAPVCLDVFAGGILIGQLLANRHRRDLEGAGIGSGHHSFVFTLPEDFAFAPDDIEVRRSLDQTRLAPSTLARMSCVSSAA
jgi:hypothetical protein